MMKIKNYIANITLILLSIVISFILLEIVFRYLLFSDIAAFDRLRAPDNYADYFSDDDYYKLSYLFNNKKISDIPHPLLGWSGNFSSTTYIHDDSHNLQSRRPVLLYGDSFAARPHFQTILNNAPEFSQDYYLLNYGVGGYGVGQIFLLFQKSVHLYDDPFVVVSLMTLDLDRTVLSVRSGQKPYFQMENGVLTLKGVPINPDPHDFFIRHPPQITSYVYRRILYAYLPDEAVSILRPNQARIEEKKAVNEQIVLEIIKELRENDLDFIFLIFHPHWPGVSTLDSESDWRDPFLRTLLEEQNAPYIWSKDVFKQDSHNRTFSFADYIELENGHPTPYFYQLLAAEIKHQVLATSMPEQNIGINSQEIE